MATITEVLALALRHHQAGDLARAEPLYRQVLAADPRQADAWHLLGLVALQAGRSDLAQEYIRRAIELQPGNAVYYSNRGVALENLNRLDEAGASLRKAIELDPTLADAPSNLGNILSKLRRLDEASACLQQALRLNPRLPAAQNNMGNVLNLLGRSREALPYLQEAVRLQPTMATGWNNLGNAHMQLGQLDEARAAYEHAAALLPSYREVHNNLGNLLARQGQFAAAQACYQRSLDLYPDDAETRFHRSLAWLMAGDFRRGWPEYEWRWQTGRFQRRSYTQPCWDGSPFRRRTILLYAEQGFGDTIQFLRFVPLVKERGGTVLVECRPALAALVRRCPGVDGVVAADAPLPPFDVQAAVMGLPAILGTTVETIPTDIPYVFAEPERVERWGGELRRHADFKIGLAWQGSATYQWDQHRSFRLRELAPLARVPGVCLISLQKGPGVEQIAEVATTFPVVDLGPGFDEQGGAFQDTAAVLEHLDLVISADTALAHLAGAMGRPVWVAVPWSCDWRWFQKRDDSPWYPTARLFRQEKPLAWSRVFERMAASLTELMATPR